MPLITTTASLSASGFEGSNSSNLTNSYWFCVVDPRLNGSADTGFTSADSINAKYAGYSVYSTTNRPFEMTLNPASGAFNSYKIFTDTTNIPATTFVRTDSLGNTHIMYRDTSTTVKLFKYSRTNTFVAGITISGLSIPKNILIDSSNNIFIISDAGSTINVTQIDSTSYTIVSGKTFSGIVPNTYLMDNTGNIIMCGSNRLLKYDPIGNTIIWQKSISPTISITGIVIDNNNDLYAAINVTSPSSLNKIIKISSSGTKSLEYNVNVVNDSALAIDTVTNNLYYTSTNNSTSYSVTLLSTGASITAIRTIDLPITTNGMGLLGTVCSSTNAYILGSLYDNSTIRRTQGVIKIPKDLNYTTATSYSFNMTSANGTIYPYSGSINISSGTNPSLTPAINITIATSTGVTLGTFTPTSASATPSLNATTPFNFHTPLI